MCVGHQCQPHSSKINMSKRICISTIWYGSIWFRLVWFEFCLCAISLYSTLPSFNHSHTPAASSPPVEIGSHIHRYVCTLFSSFGTQCAFHFSCVACVSDNNFRLNGHFECDKHIIYFHILCQLGSMALLLFPSPMVYWSCLSHAFPSVNSLKAHTYYTHTHSTCTQTKQKQQHQTAGVPKLDTHALTTRAMPSHSDR